MINMTKFFVIFSLVSSAFAQDYAVVKEGAEVFLTGPTCGQLLEQANAINKWRKADAAPVPDSLCTCSGKCKVDLTSVMPKAALDKQNVELVKNGPNSWNSSLVSAGILSNHRYTQKSEMSFWMSSPLCRERAANEASQPGDIIAIRNSKGEEIHGFTHLTKDLSYTKNGFRAGTTYQLSPPDEIYKKYAVGPGCQKINKSPSAGQNCPFYANVFRCDSMDEYLEKNPMHSKDLRENWKELDKLDCALSGMMFKDTFTADQSIILETAISSVLALAEEQIASTKVSAEDKFLWKAIKFKAISLVEQVGML